VGPLPKGTSGRYTPVLNTIVVNAAAMDEDPRAIAAVIVHELTHAGQVKILGEGGERDCVHMEVDAFRVQSLARSAFWEDDPPAGTGLERELSWIAHIVATDGEPGLYKLVVDTPGYQQECELLVPDGAGPRTAQPGAVRWPTVLLVPPTATRVPSTPTPAASRPTSDLAARCYTLAFAIGSQASVVPSASPATGPIGSPNKSIDTLTAVNAQCRDIADKYGGPGVDCYEPAARDFWRTGAVLMADRSQTGEVANSALVGRVATCLRDLPR